MTLRKLFRRAPPKELPASLRNEGSFRQATGVLFRRDALSGRVGCLGTARAGIGSLVLAFRFMTGPQKFL